MNNYTRPDIIIMLADVFPEELETKFKNELEYPSLNIQSHRVNFGTFNCLEWAIPTAMGIFIFKSYFDGFLKETGKDHYNMLRNWLKKNSESSRSIKTTIIAAAQSTHKLDNKKDTQSKAFAVHAINPETQTKIKFMFDESLSQKAWNEAIDNLLNLLEPYYASVPKDEITIMIEKNNFQKDIYARIKSENGTWEFTDLRKHLEDKMNKNE